MLRYTYVACLVIHKIRKMGLIFSSNVSDDKKPTVARKCTTGSILKPNSISLGYSSVLKKVIQVSYLHAREAGFESWPERRKS